MKKEGNFLRRSRRFAGKAALLEKKCKNAVRNFVHHEEKLKK